MSKITLDGELVDSICKESLGQHIGYIKQSIAKLEKRKVLKAYQEEDLENDIIMLKSMQKVYKYYGGK